MDPKVMPLTWAVVSGEPHVSELDGVARAPVGCDPPAVARARA